MQYRIIQRTIVVHEQPSFHPKETLDEWAARFGRGKDDMPKGMESLDPGRNKYLQSLRGKSDWSGGPSAA